MRAQITLFIIIGILIVIAFGIAIYIGTAMSKRIQTAETTQHVEQIQPIQDYVTSCLDLATKEGLKLIGRQAGVLYQSQGGATPDYIEGEGTQYTTYTDAELGTLKTPFLILPPDGTVGTLFYSDPPKYPFENFPYAGEELIFNGYYGTSQLPPLYKTSVEGEKVENSVQQNLETFIAKRTTQCADWQQFEKQGFRITTGPATASLIFAQKQEQFAGEQYVNIELNWPIEITTPAGDKTKLENFAVREDTRLATIYYTVKTIIDGDATDVSYSPQGSGAITTTTIPQEENTIVITRDEQSLIDNKPFEFWIPRKNRRPALWQVEQINKVFHVTPEGRGTEIRIIGNELQFNDPCPEGENPHTVQLNSSEPDEQEIVYGLYIPGSATSEIPQDAATFGAFSITVFSKDKSQNSNDWFDSQEIPLTVTICETR